MLLPNNNKNVSVCDSVVYDQADNNSEILNTSSFINNNSSCGDNQYIRSTSHIGIKNSPIVPSNHSDLFLNNSQNLGVSPNIHNNSLSHSFQSLSFNSSIRANSSNLSLPQKLEECRKPKQIKQLQPEKLRENVNRNMVNILHERDIIKSGVIKQENKAIRSTLPILPATQQLLEDCKLPLGLLIQPLSGESEQTLPLIRTNHIPRCRTLSCRAYMSPYVTITDNKHRWQCPLCLRINDFHPYTYDDQSLVLLMTANSVEYIAPRENSNKLPTYAFLFDLTQFVTSRLLPNTMQIFLETIGNNINMIPGAYRSKIVFIGYDSALHLYRYNQYLDKYEELILTLPLENGRNMSQFNPELLPCPMDELIVPIGNHENAIMYLLQSIIPQQCVVEEEERKQHQQDTICGAPDNCLSNALLLTNYLMISTSGPGRITIVNASCPTLGSGGLMHQCNSLGARTDFYKTLSLDLAQLSVGVDIFYLGIQALDLASLVELVRYGGGNIYHYPYLSGSSNARVATVTEQATAKIEQQRLVHDLQYYLTRTLGMDAVLRIRYSTPGLTVQASHGNMFARAPDLYALANVTPDWTVGIKLGLDECGLPDLVYIQAALLYTNAGEKTGERRIRVHTIRLSVSYRLDDIFRTSVAESIICLLAKIVADRLISQCINSDDNKTRKEIINTRKALIDAIVDPCFVFNKLVRGNNNSFAYVDQVWLPSRLRMLPLYIWGLMRFITPLPSDVPYGTMTVMISNLNLWRYTSPHHLISFIYPSLYSLDNISDNITDSPPLHNQLLHQSFESSSTSFHIISSSSSSSPQISHASTSSSASSSPSNISDNKIICNKPPVNILLPTTFTPVRLHLTQSNLSPYSIFLLDHYRGVIVIIGQAVANEIQEQLIGDNDILVPQFNNALSVRLNCLLRNIQIQRPLCSSVTLLDARVTKSGHFSIMSNEISCSLIEDITTEQFENGINIWSGVRGEGYIKFLEQIQKKMMK